MLPCRPKDAATDDGWLPSVVLLSHVHSSVELLFDIMNGTSTEDGFRWNKRKEIDRGKTAHNDNDTAIDGRQNVVFGLLLRVPDFIFLRLKVMGLVR